MSRKNLPYSWPLTLVVATILTGCDRCSSSDDPTVQSERSDAAALDASGVNEPLQITDVKVGTGAEATPGKKISVLYKGTLADGSVFDKSEDRDAPFSFVLGSGLVIAGWDEGVKGMREGGQRKLDIPPALAYGSRGFGGLIPPNARLTFEIELLKVE